MKLQLIKLVKGLLNSEHVYGLQYAKYLVG